jgi:hypothetical protein
MVDAKPRKEDRHKVDSELDKLPQVEEQHNVDAKPANKPPKVDAVVPKVDFCTEFTTERKFEQHELMLLWFCDLAVKLEFVAVITKFDNRGMVERDMLHLYVHKEMEEKITLKSCCPFKVKSYLLRQSANAC